MRVISIIHVLCAVCIVAIGVLWSTDIENFELVVARALAPKWLIIPVIARIFISLMFAIPLLVLINCGRVYRVIAAFPLIFMTTCLFTNIEYGERLVLMGGFSGGLTLGMNTLVLLIGSIVMLLIIILPNPLIWKLKKWPVWIVAVTTFTIPYFIYPLFIDEITTLYQPQTERYQNLVKQANKAGITKTPNQLYMFVSPTCSHCKLAMKKIGISALDKNGLKQESVTVIIPVDLIPEQKKDLNILSGYQVIELEDEDFLRITMGRFPMAAYTTSSGLFTYVWSGRTLNYYALHFLSKHQ